MYTLEYLRNELSVYKQFGDKLVPARSERMDGLYGFWLRCKAAWAVLTDKADAFTWPEGQ